MDAGGPGPLWGVRALGCWHGASPPQGHMASPDPSQSGERVRGRWPGEERAWPVGPACSATYGVVTDDYASPALLQYEWVSLLQSTDSGPRAHLGRGDEPAGAATTVIWLCIT